MTNPTDQTPSDTTVRMWAIEQCIKLEIQPDRVLTEAVKLYDWAQTGALPEPANA